MRNIIISFLVCLMVVLSFSACNGNGGDNKETQAKQYKITLETSNDYVLTSDKKTAEAFDVVTINVQLNSIDKKLVAIKYGQETVGQNNNGSFSFFMPVNDVTVSAVLEDYEENLKSDTSSRPFISFSSGNAKTVVPNTGTAKLYLSINASWMTILNSSVTTSNPRSIPEDAVTIENQTSSSSNAIIGAYICIDTTKIQKGYSWLDFNFVNGNSSSQKGKITVKLSVDDSISVETWKETLIFDMTSIDSKYNNADFSVYLNDYDYIEGMTTEDYVSFSNLKIEEGKIVIEIEYAVNHKYVIGLYIPNENPSETVWFTLLESVGLGSSSIGYNQYKNLRLSFVYENSSLTIGVTNPQ